MEQQFSDYKGYSISHGGSDWIHVFTSCTVICTAVIDSLPFLTAQRFWQSTAQFLSSSPSVISPDCPEKPGHLRPCLHVEYHHRSYNFALYSCLGINLQFLLHARLDDLESLLPPLRPTNGGFNNRDRS